ncbi:ribonuclease-domain-containing protein [Trichoderma citrinoviride]|uniref:ribonuclease T1 n=1 Tax=Trichoderma citrinoviride TaxID=58853 RepID=A0A2T4BLV8_9HYPO|nr:ribonuclease-domain-containing protein [Trichoderma citrinoviride]PTB70304.1 ribonuclease-domain-containing protein [Trichoderma citrinoviride]
MVSFKSVAAVVGFVASASAAAIDSTLVDKRAACVYTCGSVCYWQSDIDAALSKGYSLYKSGDDEDSYPHQYNDYEGFKFPTASPWYEFPILSSFDVYTGGSPGPDRVIFDSKGNFDSVITHTGASGDDFVACKKD